MLWGGEFWTDGYFVNTASKFINEDSIRNSVKAQGTGLEFKVLHQSARMDFFPLDAPPLAPRSFNLTASAFSAQNTGGQVIPENWREVLPKKCCVGPLLPANVSGGLDAGTFNKLPEICPQTTTKNSRSDYQAGCILINLCCWVPYARRMRRLSSSLGIGSKWFKILRSPPSPTSHLKLMIIYVFVFLSVQTGYL